MGGDLKRSMCFTSRRWCGLGVMAPDLYSGGPGFKSRSDHLDLFHGRPVKLISLPPVGICNICYVHLVCNISNTRKRVSSDIQTPRSRLKKRGAAEFFLNDFEVFGYLKKHTFECLIWLLK